ncbi:MAG: membrane protease subunit (stomatin/prohibitin family) [bacterium]|jgi:membrane protease subunit (stomatin/prohibitin family)
MPQLMEIIEFLDDSGNTMVQRMPKTGSGEFKMGAQLIVRESQKAVFFRDGKALDIFSAGRHVLKTQNIPILTKLVTSLGYGQDSPFKSEVYFLNLKLFRNLKWGTKEPILFRDSELKMIRLRGYGAFSITIKEPSLFLNKVVGTQALFRDSDIADYLKSIILQKLHIVLGEQIKTVFDLPQHFDNLSILVRNALNLDFEGLGLELHDFLINSISVPLEVQKMIDTRSGMSAIGNMDEFMKFQMGQSMEKAAENPTGSAGEGMGLGAGLGMGFMMPQMISQVMQQPNNQDTSANIDSLTKLKQLKELLDIEAISEKEFYETKKRILNNL